MAWIVRRWHTEYVILVPIFLLIHWHSIGDVVSIMPIAFTFLGLFLEYNLSWAWKLMSIFQFCLDAKSNPGWQMSELVTELLQLPLCGSVCGCCVWILCVDSLKSLHSRAPNFISGLTCLI